MKEVSKPDFYFTVFGLMMPLAASRINLLKQSRSRLVLDAPNGMLNAITKSKSAGLFHNYLYWMLKRINKSTLDYWV